MALVVPIGKLQMLAVIEKNTPIDVEGGGQVDNYEPILTTYGYLKKRSGFRTLEAGWVNMSNTWEFTCRFQNALENDMSGSLRLFINNKLFTVDSYEQVEEQRFWYKFILKQAE